MPDLLFVSDNPKLEQVRDLLQPMLKIEIDVTADVERAMDDVLNHPPSVICIQEQMAGTTVEQIVSQVRTIPENGTPLLVLLREGNDDAIPPEQIFKHVIDLSLPVEQLVKSILRAVLQPAFKLRRSEICISHGQDLPAICPKEETVPDESPVAAAKGQIPAELLKAFEHNYRSRRRGRWIKYAAISLTACLAAFAWHLTSSRHGQGGAIYQTLPARPSAQLPPAQLPPAQRPAAQRPAAQLPAAQRPTIAPVPPATKSTPTPVPASAVIVRKAPAAPVPPAKKSTPAPAPASAVIVRQAPAAPQPAAGTVTASKLPSFIPKKGRDSAYSQQKPGWERYTDAIHEFRIFRSGNRIKTVQVLAATPDTISETFLKSVLGEISGTKVYQETTQEEEHGFLVKRGSAGPGVKILIYTQKSRIRAFVISIS